MKIRNGFVSNSSSSSFCILGADISDKIDEIEEKLNQLDNKRVDIYYDISGGDGKYVGISATRMADNETPSNIKQELIDALKKIGIEIQYEDIDWIEDGGYNG